MTKGLKGWLTRRKRKLALIADLSKRISDEFASQHNILSQPEEIFSYDDSEYVERSFKKCREMRKLRLEIEEAKVSPSIEYLAAKEAEIGVAIIGEPRPTIH